MLRCARAEGDSLILRTTGACWLLVAALGLACSQESSDGASQASAAQRGQQIYGNVCIACHNARSDPARLARARRWRAPRSALLEAKLLRGEYPPGYTPSRPGQTMPRFDYLRDHIGDLAAVPTTSTDCAR